MSNKQRIEYLETILKVIKNKYITHHAIPYTRTAGISALISTTNKNKICQRFDIVLNRKCKKSFNIATILFYLLTLLLILSCYVFVLQPSYEPFQAYMKPQIFDISPENAYLKPNNNNSYDLYTDGKYRAVVEDINVEPFSSLPIK